MNSDFPNEMSEYFRLKWDVERLWSIDLPIRTGRVSDFEWHLDCPFWATKPPNNIFDLRPRDVLENPESFPERYQRIVNSDTMKPIDVASFGSLLVVLDGIHRLANLVLSEENEMRYRIVPREYLRKIVA